mmetsp:Transcript_16201/g.38403  ORF Transcript_16201/g.38403 Transcript_16201/m.38403 type:complete len:364 (-) Transcript_16201:478-1569(-)
MGAAAGEPPCLSQGRGLPGGALPSELCAHGRTVRRSLVHVLLQLPLGTVARLRQLLPCCNLVVEGRAELHRLRRPVPRLLGEALIELRDLQPVLLEALAALGGLLPELLRQLVLERRELALSGARLLRQGGLPLPLLVRDPVLQRVAVLLPVLVGLLQSPYELLRLVLRPALRKGNLVLELFLQVGELDVLPGLRLLQAVPCVLLGALQRALQLLLLLRDEPAEVLREGLRCRLQPLLRGGELRAEPAGILGRPLLRGPELGPALLVLALDPILQRRGLCPPLRCCGLKLLADLFDVLAPLLVLSGKCGLDALQGLLERLLDEGMKPFDLGLELFACPTLLLFHSVFDKLRDPKPQFFDTHRY